MLNWAYLVSFNDAALSAAEPAEEAESVTYELAKELQAVTSQVKHLPVVQGTCVAPSGRFPSDRSMWKPNGSTSVPQIQECGAQMAPKRKATTIRAASSSSLRPILDTGNACNQALA